MFYDDLEEQARIGVWEAIAWYTVAIDASLASQLQNDCATGSLVEVKDKCFIVTCKHVVEPNYRDEDLRFLYRGERAYTWLDKEDLKKANLSQTGRTFPRTISIINRFYSDDLDDLALLEVNPLSKEVEDYHFFEIKDRDIKTPDIDTWVYMMGVSRELTRTVTHRGDFAVFPYFGLHVIIDKTLESAEFDSERHFLIGFHDKECVEPKGLSGCGIWVRRPSGPDKLWTPNIYLIGVQSSIFRRQQAIKATRIERLYRLMDRIQE